MLKFTLVTEHIAIGEHIGEKEVCGKCGPYFKNQNASNPLWSVKYTKMRS